MIKTRISFILILLVIMLLVPFKGSSQETALLLSEYVAELLDPVYGVDQSLISGSVYYGPRKGSISGHAYFIDESWKEGSVTIGKHSYHNLDLMYDIEKNKIILKFININGSVAQISLNKENIDNFGLTG